MARLLSPRLLVLIIAVLGLATTALAIAGETNLALGCTGLALTTLAVLVWITASRILGSRKQSAEVEKALTHVAIKVEDSDRRLVAAIETLRRDLHNHDRNPST